MQTCSAGKFVARCEPFQRLKNALARLRVSMRHESVIIIKYLAVKPVLHMIDEAAWFCTAKFLSKISTGSIWDAILLCSSSVYTGLHMIADETSIFRKVFGDFTAVHVLNPANSCIESHNSIGIGEPYRICDHPAMHRQLLLPFAIERKNGTIVP